METINVARLIEPGKPLEMGIAEKPAPGTRDVLIKVAACGLVPNSYNIVNGLTQLGLPQLPAIFGLDVAGTVEAVGDHVIGIAPGDRVYVDPFLTCENCHHCRRGRRDMCESACLRGYMYATPNGAELINQYPYGGLSEYIVSPDRRVAKLPDSIDFLTAARFGYIGTSFAALRKGWFGAGQTLLINGVTGTLGVAAVAIALGMGATKILGVGRNRELLERIAAMAAPGRIETVSSEDGHDLVAWVKDQTRGLGADVMYDCLGVGGDVHDTSTLMHAIKAGGRAVLVAAGVAGPVAQEYFEILLRDVHPVGSQWFNEDDLDQMIEMIGSGVIDLSFLEHRTFSLAEVNEAFNAVGSRLGGFVNVAVVP